MKNLICLSLLVLTFSFNAFADKVVVVQEPLSENQKLRSEIFMSGTAVGFWVLGAQSVQIDGYHLEQVLQKENASAWEIRSAKRSLALSRVLKWGGELTAIVTSGHLAYKLYKAKHEDTAEIQAIVPAKKSVESEQHESLGCSFGNQICEPNLGHQVR